MHAFYPIGSKSAPIEEQALLLVIDLVLYLVEGMEVILKLLKDVKARSESKKQSKDNSIANFWPKVLSNTTAVEWNK